MTGTRTGVIADPLEPYLRAGTMPMTYVARDGAVLMINDVGAANLGRTVDQIVGRSLFDLMPETAGWIRERMDRAFETREPVASEQDFVLPVGTRRFRSVMHPVFDGAGAPLGVQIVSIDVTAEREAEAALRRANDKLSVIFEHSPYMIMLLGPGGVVNYINRPGAGFSLDQVLGSDSHLFLAAEFHQRYDEALERAFGQGQPSRFDVRDIHGSSWEATFVAVNDTERVEQVICFGVDVTEMRKSEEEQRRLEAQVQHTQKLESLGVLAGGIAHDFNNILAAIIANADLALRDSPASAELPPRLQEILRASERAAGLCKQMLAYAGRGQLIVERLDLSGLVGEMAQLVEVSVAKGVRLVRDLSRDLPAVEGDANQLRQVVLNLITNASDALGNREGSIWVRTRTERVDTRQLAVGYLREDLAAGEYVVLEVEDTGHGMDEATRARMFDPFFSTKSPGRGLGLASTLGIVRRHRGAIVVESAVGRGTRVRAIFPVVAGKPVGVPIVEASAISGHGLVLVVDDEDQVRRVVSRVLASSGYEVLMAADGREALALFDGQRGRVRLVVLDLSMPRLGGEETLRAFREREPKVPVILMSGYSDSTVRDASARFLPKPFRPRALLELAAELLAATS